MPSKYLYQPALELLNSQLTGNERVVIRGSTGWVGRTATFMLDALGVPTMLFASRDRNELIGSKEFQVFSWDEARAIEFEPTHIIDAAYLTREFTDGKSPEEYLRLNEKLTQEAINIVSKLENIKLITFSSGVTEIQSEQGKPYTISKKRDEEIFETLANTQNKKITIFRVWSISGALVTKKRGFAFSEFILDGFEGCINITAKSKVYRKFCLIDEVIASGFSNFENNFRLVDTAGELIEIHELAELIRDIVNPNAKLNFSELENSVGEDLYFSDSLSWKNLLKAIDYEPASIIDQIKLVSNALA